MSMKKSCVKARPAGTKQAGNRASRQAAARRLEQGRMAGMDIIQPRGQVASTGGKRPASSKAG
jgi:hypothetical protein